MGVTAHRRVVLTHLNSLRAQGAARGEEAAADRVELAGVKRQLVSDLPCNVRREGG